MKVYVLTSAAKFTSYDGTDAEIEINTKVFLSVVEAQLAMAEQVESEATDAASCDYTIDKQEIYPTNAVLCYSNTSFSEIVWDITEHDVQVNSYEHFTECEKKLIALVEEYGKPADPTRSGKESKRLLLPRKENLICAGGWLGQDSETVDMISVVDGSLRIGTEMCTRASEEFPSDDLQHLLDEISDNFDFIRFTQEYFQPEMKSTNDVPKELHSFHAFATAEGAKKWMTSRGYKTKQYTIIRYTGDDIENPTILDGNGDIIFCPDIEEVVD